MKEKTASKREREKVNEKVRRMVGGEKERRGRRKEEGEGGNGLGDSEKA